jgi:hypothetical protein
MKDMDAPIWEWKRSHVMRFEMVYRYKVKVTLVIYVSFASVILVTLQAWVSLSQNLQMHLPKWV